MTDTSTVQVNLVTTAVDITSPQVVVDVSPPPAMSVDIAGVTIIKETSLSAFKLQLKITMQPGVLTYVLPWLPQVDAMQVFINGVLVEFVVDGVNLTITSYSAGEIEVDDELIVYY